MLENENGSPASPNAKPCHPNVGPLPIKMQIADNVSSTSLFLRSKPKVNPFPEGTTSPTSVLLPSPREETSRPRAFRNRTSSQRRLETAQSNQIQPNDSFIPSDLSITSSMSSTNHVIQDYYTEMMNEAHRESRQALFEGNRDVSRAFDAMLPSGMAWAEVTRAGRVTCIACSRSDVRDEAMGQPLLIAVGTDDGAVAVMEIIDIPSTPLHKQIDFGSNRSKKIGTVKELPREGIVRSLDFSSDGRWLVVGGDDGTACLMRLTFRAFPGLGNALNSVEVVQEFEREDRVYCVQFSPDGSLLAVGGFDGLVTIASVEQFDNSKEPPHHARPMTLQKEISRPGLVLSLDWSPDGTMLAVGGSDKRCTIFDDSWRIVFDVQGSASVTSVKWNPAGSQVAVGCSDGTVAVVNIKSQSIPGEMVRGVEKTDPQKKGDIRTVFSCSHTGGPGKVNALTWSPDGHFLAIGGSDHCCSIIETGTFVLVHEIRRSGNVTSVVWNQRRLLTRDDGRYLVIGSEDRSVIIMKTGVVSEGGDTISRTASDISDASSSFFSIGSLSQHEWILREDSFLDIEDVDSFSQNAPPWSPLDSARADRVITAVSFSRHKKKDPSLYIAFASSNGTVTIKSTKDWRTVQVRLQSGKY
jgi:WD40 repeat protein